MTAFLEEEWWGVLSTSADGRPYAVPVVYGFDGDGFWIVSREGRKTRNLERNPAVCLSVSRVAGDGSAWASVVVTGTGRLVDGVRARLAALRALRRQCGRLGRPRPADAARMAGTRVIRIEPEEITGRRLGGGVSGEGAAEGGTGGGAGRRGDGTI